VADPGCIASFRITTPLCAGLVTFPESVSTMLQGVRYSLSYYLLLVVSVEGTHTVVSVGVVVRYI